MAKRIDVKIFPGRRDEAKSRPGEQLHNYYFRHLPRARMRHAAKT